MLNFPNLMVANIHVFTVLHEQGNVSILLDVIEK